MNYLLVIAISIISFFPENHFVEPEISGEENLSDSYCNARYDFCVEYPKDVFTAEVTPTNADGIFLSTPNREVTMAVFGEYNAFDFTLEEQHNFLLKSISESDGYFIDQLTVYSVDGFTTNIETPEKQIELRSQKIGDHFVTVIIKMNNENKSKYLNIYDEIKVRILI